MLKIASICKASFLAFSLLCGIAFDRVTNKQYTDDEIRQRIEKRIEKLREATDDTYGQGYFDKIVAAQEETNPNKKQ